MKKTITINDAFISRFSYCYAKFSLPCGPYNIPLRHQHCSPPPPKRINLPYREVHFTVSAVQNERMRSAVMFHPILWSHACTLSSVSTHSISFSLPFCWPFSSCVWLERVHHSRKGVRYYIIIFSYVLCVSISVGVRRVEYVGYNSVPDSVISCEKRGIWI